MHHSGTTTVILPKSKVALRPTVRSRVMNSVALSRHLNIGKLWRSRVCLQDVVATA
jgi:hypothetical protein